MANNIFFGERPDLDSNLNLLISDKIFVIYNIRSDESKGGRNLEGTVWDLPKRNISHGPKWMILECTDQLFEAIKIKIFLESSMTILKSKMAIFEANKWPIMCLIDIKESENGNFGPIS